MIMVLIIVYVPAAVNVFYILINPITTMYLGWHEGATKVLYYLIIERYIRNLRAVLLREASR
jgi:hypothetical protein